MFFFVLFQTIMRNPSLIELNNSNDGSRLWEGEWQSDINNSIWQSGSNDSICFDEDPWRQRICGVMPAARMRDKVFTFLLLLAFFF